MQLLIFAMLAFVLLIRMKLYPPEIPSVVLNSDWFYRRLAPAVGLPIIKVIMTVWHGLVAILAHVRTMVWDAVDLVMDKPISGPTIPGRAVMVQAVLLTIILIFGYAIAS
jgi:multicomponent Na+:H+ antiporter subunit D